jgi:hypothetical protein
MWSLGLDCEATRGNSRRRQGCFALTTKEARVILVTEANDIVVAFGTGSIAYWTLTDASGKLQKAFRAEPGQPRTAVAVSDVQPRFGEEIAFWKEYLGVPE